MRMEKAAYGNNVKFPRKLLFWFAFVMDLQKLVNFIRSE